MSTKTRFEKEAKGNSEMAYYAGTQVTDWHFQNKGTRTSPARLSFV